MPYTDLYKAVQSSGNGRISTRWLRGKAIEFSGIEKVKEQWSGVVDAASIRGFYIEGPLGPPVPLKAKEALIVLARDVCTGPHGDYHRRFIYTKELMHVFDTEDEKASNKDQFDKQIQRLKDPSADVTPQYRAELKAFWRALGVLCTEAKRREYKTLLQKDKASWDVVAVSLGLPMNAVRNLMGDEFERNLHHSM